MNEDPKDALLKQYEDEITQLKKLLAQYQTGELKAGTNGTAAQAAQMAIVDKLSNSFKN